MSNLFFFKQVDDLSFADWIKNIKEVASPLSSEITKAGLSIPSFGLKVNFLWKTFALCCKYYFFYVNKLQGKPDT